MKVTVVGAGAVGATFADNIALKELATGYDANCSSAWL
jgi:malate/lactate dehydrogenase